MKAERPRLLRVGLILTLALGILAAPLAADAQQAGKVFRIGWLGNTPPTTPEIARIWEAFLQGLREHGYVESQNVIIERRYSEGRAERFPQFATDLVRLKVDVIVTVGTPATQAAKNATGAIPIVMAAVGAPVASGLVASLARPGGNVTGLSLLNPETSGKKLELLKEVIPGLSRIAILSNSTNQTVVAQLEETAVRARALRVQVQPLDVRGPDDLAGLEEALRAAIRDGARALLALDDPLTFGYRTQIAGLAAKSRLPAIYGGKLFVDAGGLMSYGVNLADVYRRAAAYVDKILRGAKPADLPVEQPTKFELVINLKTAKALGLTIPQSVLFRADKVIE